MLKYLSAYALASLSKPNPTKDDVSAILKASGVAVDKNDLDYVFTQINGRSVAALIAEGSKKISAAPAGGAAPAAAAAPAAGKPAAKEEKKKEPEPEEEDDFGMGGLF